MNILERLFKLRENGTTVRTEILAGVTTFLTIAYIMFVQPAVLSGTMFGKPTVRELEQPTALNRDVVDRTGGPASPSPADATTRGS